MTQPRSRRQNWADSPPKDWSEREAHRVSVEIQRRRGQRSGQWLSDRTAELGHRVSRAVISDLETGRRRHLTTVELTMIAAALNVPPVILLHPGPYMRECEVLPGVNVPELVAVEWFSGHRDWRIENADMSESERAESDIAEKNSHPLYLHREYFEAVMERRALANADEVGDQDRKLIELYDKRIRELAKEIESLDT